MAKCLLKSDLDRLEEIRLYVIANLDADLRLKTLCNKYGLGKSTLRKQFSDCFRISLAEYIFQWRMWKARILLHQKQYTISEIADLVGYKEVASFTRAFSKLFGFPPSHLQTV